MSDHEIKLGKEIIKKMRYHYNLILDYKSDERCNSSWNKEGIFNNTLDSEKSLLKNIDDYPKIIIAAKQLFGINNSVGFACRNLADALINYYFKNEKKDPVYLKKALKSLEEEVEIGDAFNRLRRNQYNLKGTLERIEQINEELNLLKEDPEKCSTCREEFWERIRSRDPTLKNKK